MELLMNALQEVAPPKVALDGKGVDVGTVISDGCCIIMEAATNCTRQQPAAEYLWDKEHPRWKRLVDTNDSKLIWKSINWEGDVGNGSV